MPSSYDTNLFDDHFLDQLHRWRWLIKKKSRKQEEIPLVGFSSGGHSEFVGNHPYTLGEDLRYLDWHIYARTNQLYIKDYSKQGHHYILLLVDSSASMAFGKPNKYTKSLQLAAAISYISVFNGCRVKIGLLRSSEILYSPTFHLKAHLEQIFNFLSWNEAEGKISLEKWLDHYIPKNCHIYICSDLLSFDSQKNTLTKMLFHSQDLSIIHILSLEEISPCYKGYFCLIDAETQQKKYLLLDDRSIEQYQKNLNAFKNNWISFCHKYGIHYQQVCSTDSITSILQKALNL